MNNLEKSCKCCPYGYHIDVDFLKFLDIDSDKLFKKNIILHNSYSAINKKINSPILHTQSNFIVENGKSKLCSIFKTTVQKYLNDGEITNKPQISLDGNEFYEKFEGKCRGHSEPNLDRNNPTVGCDILLVLPNNNELINNEKKEMACKTFKTEAEVYIVDNSNENKYTNFCNNNFQSSSSNKLSKSHCNYLESNKLNFSNLLNSNIYNQDALININDQKYFNNYESNKVYNLNYKYEMKDIGLQCKPTVKDAFVSTNYPYVHIENKKPECTDVSVQFDSVDGNKFLQKSINDLELDFYDNIDPIDVDINKKSCNAIESESSNFSNLHSNFYSKMNNSLNKSQIACKIGQYNSTCLNENSFTNIRHNDSNESEKYDNINDASNLISIIETDQINSYDNQLKSNNLMLNNNNIKKEINESSSNKIMISEQVINSNYENKVTNSTINNLLQSNNYNSEIMDDKNENSILDNNYNGQLKHEGNIIMFSKENVLEENSNQISLQNKGLDIEDNKVTKLDIITNTKSTLNDIFDSKVSINPPPRIVDLLESSDSDFDEDEMQSDYCIYHVNKGIVLEKSSGQVKEPKSDEIKFVPITFNQNEYLNNTFCESNIPNTNMEDKKNLKIDDKVKKEPKNDETLLTNIKAFNQISNKGPKKQYNKNSNKIIDSNNINNSIDSIDDNMEYFNDLSSESLMSTSSSSLENLLADSQDNNTFSSPETTEKPQEDILDIKRQVKVNKIDLLNKNNSSLHNDIISSSTNEVLELYSKMEDSLNINSTDIKFSQNNIDEIHIENFVEPTYQKSSEINICMTTNDNINEKHQIKVADTSRLDSFDSTDDSASVDTIKRSNINSNEDNKYNSDYSNSTSFSGIAKSQSMSENSLKNSEPLKINNQEINSCVQNISSNPISLYEKIGNTNSDIGLNEKSQFSINTSTNSTNSFDSLEKKIESLKRLSAKRKNIILHSQSIPLDTGNDSNNLLNHLNNSDSKNVVENYIIEKNQHSFSQPNILENFRNNQDLYSNFSMEVLRLILNSSRSMDTGLDTQYIFQQYMSALDDQNKEGSTPKTLVQLSVENIQRFTKSICYSMVSNLEDDKSHDTINHTYREALESSSHDTLYDDEKQLQSKFSANDSTTSTDELNLLDTKWVSAPAIFSQFANSEFGAASTSQQKNFSESEEKLMNACLSVSKHLNTLESSNNDLQQITNIELIRSAWFATCSCKQSKVEEVGEMLLMLKQFGEELIEMVVNMVDGDGNTALHYAVSHNNIGVIELLLSVGICNVDIQNSAGYTVNMLAALLLPLNDERESMLLAHMFQIGDVNCASERTGQTALMLASSHGRKEMVEMLLKAGSDVNTQDEDGSTALMCASEHNHMNIVQLLLSNPMCNSSLSDIDGSTALSIAMDEGNQEIGVLIYTHMKKHTTLQDSAETLE